jgi:hypothetical protein
MLVLEDVQEEARSLSVARLFVFFRRNLKLENLAWRGDVGVECRTGRGEASTGA